MLAQWQQRPSEAKGHWRLVIHTSRALTDAERNYGKTDGESVAIYNGIMRNKTFLYGTDF